MNKWLLGENLTILDFVFAEVIERIKTMESDLQMDTFHQFANYEAYFQRFIAIPEILKFRASSEFMKRPYNNQLANPAW